MNVIELDSKRLSSEIKFTTETVRLEKINKRTGEITANDRVLIMVKNLKTGASIPHPLSEFLLKWNWFSYSTVKRRATEIIPFLNYILIENPDIYELGSLWDIDFTHGEDFLNSITDGRARQTVQQYESTLTEFYYFLAKKGLLNNITVEDFTVVIKKKKGKLCEEILSPFENIEYNNDNGKANLLHHLPKELIIPFLDTAIRFKPEIALGVYFQMFGGLRAGEVVNITREAITTKGSYGINGIVLNVKKRDLRPDLYNNAVKGEVKKPRYQVVLPVEGIMDELFKAHLNKYGYNNITGAMFTNRTGESMTVHNYRKHFESLKHIFLERLRHSGDSTLEGFSLTLASKKWSSHIGRGIFSNMVSDVADNANQIALARGDSSLDSALSYLSDCSAIAKKVQENLNLMYRDILK